MGDIGTPYNIVLKDDAEPVVHPLRKVPFSRLDKLKETLSKMDS